MSSDLHHAAMNVVMLNPRVITLLLSLIAWSCESSSSDDRSQCLNGSEPKTCACIDSTAQGVQMCTDGRWGLCMDCPSATMAGMPAGPSSPLAGIQNDRKPCWTCSNMAPYIVECARPTAQSSANLFCADDGGNQPCEDIETCCSRVYRQSTIDGCGACLFGADGPECSAQQPSSGGDPSMPMAGMPVVNPQVGGLPMSGGEATGSGATRADLARCASWAELNGANLSQVLHQDVSSTYQPIAVELDLGGNPNRYTTARKIMFTRVERRVGNAGQGQLECVYTGFTAFAPENSDPDRDDLNCEHVWPRSRMTPELESPALYEHQQSDIHALMPSTPESNSARGSLRFGIVTGNRNLDHAPSVVGTNRSGKMVFEPRPDRKGDVARMTMYFSIRWGLPIDAKEESILRRWHVEDPVSQREIERNERAQAAQGNRNPFVDCPSIVERLPRFESFDILDTEAGLPNP